MVPIAIRLGLLVVLWLVYIHGTIGGHRFLDQIKDTLVQGILLCTHIRNVVGWGLFSDFIIDSYSMSFLASRLFPTLMLESSFVVHSSLRHSTGFH